MIVTMMTMMVMMMMMIAIKLMILFLRIINRLSVAHDLPVLLLLTLHPLLLYLTIYFYLSYVIAHIFNLNFLPVCAY